MFRVRTWSTTSSTFGAGIKFYPKGGFFVRPEARLYLVNNNTDFSAARVTRYGLSIGYTFK